jgi:hypothetical protein
MFVVDDFSYINKRLREISPANGTAATAKEMFQSWFSSGGWLSVRDGNPPKDGSRIYGVKVRDDGHHIGGSFVMQWDLFQDCWVDYNSGQKLDPQPRAWRPF